MNSRTWPTSASSNASPPPTPSCGHSFGPVRPRLRDAANTSLAIESRFDLAYNAAHALALAALRRRGFRSESRYVVFQALPHTAGIPVVTWRVLATAHGQRNLIEYEGGGAVDEGMVRDLLAAARVVERAVLGLD